MVKKSYAVLLSGNESIVVEDNAKPLVVLLAVHGEGIARIHIDLDPGDGVRVQFAPGPGNVVEVFGITRVGSPLD
jgi:hypothetical protein